MGRTYATAMIIGADSTREYNFLVDTGATHIGLPQREIDDLGLEPIPQNGVLQVRTAVGVVELQAYGISGVIDGRGFVGMVTPAPIPLLGYELLENLGYKVNPVSRSLERISQDEFGPPFMLLREENSE